MAASPYSKLEPRAFWRTGVSERAPLDPGDLYRPRFRIRANDPIVTIGSCFAQHIGRTLRQAGLNVVDGEPLPAYVPDELAHKYGYRLFSARYANVYTVQQFKQLLLEAEGGQIPQERVWRKGDRFVDAQRPGVEPDGLPDPDAVLAHRATHLDAVKKAFSKASLVVFTFGLTEAWRCRSTGVVFPTAPGTIAGDFDPERYEFVNFNALEVFEAFSAVREIIMRWSKDVRFLITVSPVPLTATASGQHVEVATCYSKAVLRSVCGLAYDSFDNVDYFPSFEIITSQNARGSYFEANMRSVSPVGVATAMTHFMQAHGIKPTSRQAPNRQVKLPRPKSPEDVVCEESLLEAFSG